MKGHKIPYSPAEREWLEANRLLPIGDYHAAFQAAFPRPDVSAQHLHSMRTRKGWKTGRTGTFVKGSVPANKGKACPPGVGGRHPNAQRCHFKKGDRTGFAADLYKPIGTERQSKDGYLERKIHDGMPLQSRWRAVHLIEWETVNGPIPKGSCLKCVDGDKNNTNPTNWLLISRSILPTLNGGRHKRMPSYDEASPEVRPALLALAQVKVRASKLSRGETP